MTVSTSTYQMETATLISTSSSLPSLSSSHTNDQVIVLSSSSSSEMAELNCCDDTGKWSMSPTKMINSGSPTVITTTVTTAIVDPVVVVASPEIAEPIVCSDDDDGIESISPTAAEASTTPLPTPLTITTTIIAPTIIETEESVTPRETVIDQEVIVSSSEITTELDCCDDEKDSILTTTSATAVAAVTATISSNTVATEIVATDQVVVVALSEQITEPIVSFHDDNNDDETKSLVVPTTTSIHSTTTTTATLSPTPITTDKEIPAEMAIRTETATTITETTTSTTNPVHVVSSDITTEPIVSCDDDGGPSTRSSSPSTTTRDEVSDHPTSIVQLKPRRKYTNKTTTSLDTMDSMRPSFRKMRSTGMILSEPALNGDTCSNTDDDDEEKEEDDKVEDDDEQQGGAFEQVISSFKSMTTAPNNNFTITTNLDSIDVDYSDPWGKTKIVTHHNKNNNKNKQLCDSHTSYRRSLEHNAITLKLQLAEAQERADTLQNDLNITTKQCITSHQTLQDMETLYKKSKNLAEGLATVVTHLQSNATDCAGERSALLRKMDEYEKERMLMTKRAKIFKSENRRLKKEVKEGKNELVGQKMEIQGLKSENEWLKKENLRNRDRYIMDNEGSGFGGEDDENDNGGSTRAVSMLDGLPVIAEFREFLAPSSKSNRSQGSEPGVTQTSTKILEAPSANNLEDDTQPNISLPPSYETRYTSFADIQHGSDNNDGDSGLSNDEENMTQEILILPHLSATTNTTNSSGKKRIDIRRMRRKSSTAARQFFNALAQKHTQGSMDVSEDDVSDSNPVASVGRRRRSSGPSPKRAALGTEINKMSPTRDLPARWQNFVAATPPRDDRNIDVFNDNPDTSSIAERFALTPSKWNWLWKSENNLENTATIAPPPASASQRYISPWFLNANTKDNDPHVPPPTNDSRIEIEACGTSLGSSITKGAIESIEDSGFRNTNTLVPRRLESPAVFF